MPTCYVKKLPPTEHAKRIEAFKKSLCLARENVHLRAEEDVPTILSSDTFLQFLDSIQVSWEGGNKFRVVTGRCLKRPRLVFQDGFRIPFTRYIREQACFVGAPHYRRINPWGISRAMAGVLKVLASAFPIKDSDVLTYEGEDVLDAYRRGVGCRSCMTGEVPFYVNGIRWYADNPQAVKMLVFPGHVSRDGTWHHRSDDAEAGLRNNQVRALLWTFENGDQYLDRRYPNNTISNFAIHNWATQKGYKIGKNLGKIHSYVVLNYPKPIAGLLEDVPQLVPGTPWSDMCCLRFFHHASRQSFWFPEGIRTEEGAAPLLPELAFDLLKGEATWCYTRGTVPFTIPLNKGTTL